MKGHTALHEAGVGRTPAPHMQCTPKWGTFKRKEEGPRDPSQEKNNNKLIKKKVRRMLAPHLKEKEKEKGSAPFSVKEKKRERERERRENKSFKGFSKFMKI
jgi:hypothetical protein